ncbi:ethanolamine utilization protein [Paenibacillus agilis]|uniref:Ethanolamine utilization protein n=1 Tax=Paenibacillus agilis TaxID=3020863 RepID=A0A559IXZ3_9BACL|nr:ethanolamine utilization protein [Paenibacillus agilis]TVX92476.1 ethanolamine utilization protein [Paenibacillus agilis]
MNLEAHQKTALIQAVTDEVMRRLEQMKQGQSTVTKKRAVLLSMESLPELESLLNPHVEVSYYEASMRDCDLLIIPKVCLQLLANLANGLSAGPRERFVLTMLLKGRQVVVLEEGLLYRKYKATAPIHLYKLYEGFAHQLSNYGIRTVKTSELLSVCLEHGQGTGASVETLAEDMDHQDSQQQEKQLQMAQQQSDAQLRCSLTRTRTEETASSCATPQVSTAALSEAMTSEVLTSKVITEAVVKKFRQTHHRDEIVISKSSIITPLAQDYLRMQHMQVHRR